MRFITEQLREAGCPASAIEHDNAHRRSHLDGSVGNLIVKLPGTLNLPRRQLSAHTDTVPICVGAMPVHMGDQIRAESPDTGVGADDRAGVAAVLLAAVELLKKDLPHPPLTLVFTVQEEVGVVGTRLLEVDKLGQPALGFNFDSSSPSTLFIGATGSRRITARIRGIAAHAGGNPRNGVSAITIAANAIAKLHAEGWLGAVEKHGDKGTVNVGTVHGGSADNVVPGEVNLTADIRSHSRSFRDEIYQHFIKVFETAATGIRNIDGDSGRVELSDRLAYESFALEKDEPVVRTAYKAVTAVTNNTPNYVVGDGGLDANWITSHGIPTVTIGTGQHNGHSVHEYLDLNEFMHSCNIALRLATASEG